MAEPKSSSAIERHIQTGIALLVTGLLGWVGLNSHNTALDIATLKTEIAGLKAQIEMLQRTSSNGYSQADAARDFAVRDEFIRENRNAIRALQNLYGAPGAVR